MKRAKVEGPPMRVCVHCHQEKKIAQFSRDPSGPDGRQTWCMICMKVSTLAIQLRHHQMKAGRYRVVHCHWQDGNVQARRQGGLEPG